MAFLKTTKIQHSTFESHQLSRSKHPPLENRELRPCTMAHPSVQLLRLGWSVRADSSKRQQGPLQGDSNLHGNQEERNSAALPYLQVTLFIHE